jgi:2'-5' RNA ligase superfamily protein
VTLTHLVNHWTESPHWRPGRELWTFYLTIPGDPAAQALVRSYQDSMVGFEHLDLILEEWLHATIHGLDFAEALDSESAHRIFDHVADALEGVAFPPMTLEAPELDTDAIYLPLRPAHPLVEIRRLILEAAAVVLGDRQLFQLPEPTNGFDPHISIAYANGDVPAYEVSARLATVPHPTLLMQPPTLTLVLLRREDRRWSWKTAGRLVLDGTSAVERLDESVVG